MNPFPVEMSDSFSSLMALPPKNGFSFFPEKAFHSDRQDILSPATKQKRCVQQAIVSSLSLPRGY